MVYAYMEDYKAAKTKLSIKETAGMNSLKIKYLADTSKILALTFFDGKGAARKAGGEVGNSLKENSWFVAFASYFTPLANSYYAKALVDSIFNAVTPDKSKDASSKWNTKKATLIKGYNTAIAGLVKQEVTRQKSSSTKRKFLNGDGAEGSSSWDLGWLYAALGGFFGAVLGVIVTLIFFLRKKDDRLLKVIEDEIDTLLKRQKD